MTRSTAALRLALAAVVAGAAPLSALELQAQEPVVTADSRVDDNELYTVDELDNLLAPVALYPDPILAQLFVAATYPDQVQLAARYVEMYGSDDLDEQPWDVSVRAIARYAPVLNMLADRPNWATAVGRAYALQSGDVMASVQNLRRMARAQGNLQSTDQQRVEVEREYIRIVPAQPRVVYVPVYDPYVVYYRPINYVQVATPYWSFGIGYPIGVWLNYDLDWGTRVVYYHGWGGYGRRYHHTWYHVSRPFITFNSWYYGPRYTVIAINRTVIHRHVNYRGFGYYNTVHRNTGWDRPRLPGRGYGNARPRSAGSDRYGVPVGGGSSYRPDKVGSNVVPRVGNAPSGGSARGNDRGSDRSNGSAGRAPSNPGRTNGAVNGGRGNGNAGRGNGSNDDRVAPSTGRAPTAGRSRMPVDEDRVRPVRIGGNARPLYPKSDEAPSRSPSAGGNGNTSSNTNASTNTNAGNGSWNPRSSDRVAAAPSRGRDADPVIAPRATGGSNNGRSESPRYDAPRSSSRGSSARAESPRYEAPRSSSAPRMERSEPRSSAPRVSAPRSSEPRASAPRSSAPRASAGAPRASSAPRASAPRGGGSGSAPRASRGNGRDRG